MNQIEHSLDKSYKKHSHWCILRSRLALFIIYYYFCVSKCCNLLRKTDQCERGNGEEVKGEGEAGRHGLVGRIGICEMRRVFG